ncbi:MAG TPA: histidine kinase [Steroidobacteraceae bacterium]|nr:histidine kinase [Steroidobacteraceae bacterium]
MNSARPLAEPIAASLGRPSLGHIGSIADSPWALVLLVALPYWVAVSIVNVISGQLFWAGGPFNPNSIGLAPDVRALQHVFMTLVALGAYRAALAVGWPQEGRAVAALKHLGLGLAVAMVSRPLLALSMEMLRDVTVHWRGVFVPPHMRGLQLWLSMGLSFLAPYFLGIALLVGVRISTALARSETEKAKLHAAWTQARLHALRMQLNPHFVFNTFNTIATLLDTEPQPAKARALVLAFSELYRRTLIAAEREWMPLQEELALASDYLRLQSARFDGKLTYEITCSPELGREQIPALLLQPLVENAVLHGAADNRQPLRVWIRVNRVSTGDQGAMQIEIGNKTDGQLGSSHGAGIGLRNTSTRLSACYAGLATLQTRSTGRQFVAVITMPDPS